MSICRQTRLILKLKKIYNSRQDNIAKYSRQDNLTKYSRQDNIAK